jgi:oligopeptide transport system permease protein
MARFVLKRILSGLLAIFVLATITFFLMHLIPGGPFNAEKVSAKTQAMMMERYGFDRPVLVQYVDYMKDLARGNLGISVKKIGYTVNEVIAEKFPISLRLGLVALALSIFIGVPLGMLAAVKRDKIADRVIMFISSIGYSVPNFVVGALLLYFLGIRWQLLPIMRLDTPLHYIMPASALAFRPLAYLTRLTRSSLLEVIDQDYIKTARAKGLNRLIVIGKHALRNSLIPVVTYLGPLTADTIVGAFVVERIFSVPGLGAYFIYSITARDYPMIMGTTVFYAAILILANMMVDIAYGVIDPRIKKY